MARRNPYWLRGTDHRIGLVARPAFDDDEQQFAAVVAATEAASDAVEYETEQAARHRRKTEKAVRAAARRAARTAHLRGRPKALRTAARELGGISHASWSTTYPGDTSADARRALPGVLRGKRGGGMSWESLGQSLRELGYGPQHELGLEENRSEDWLVEALDNEAHGTPVYPLQSADYLAQREAAAAVRAHREQGRYERAQQRAARKRNPLLAVVENPTARTAPSRAAVEAFQQFHGEKPKRLRAIELPQIDELVALGGLTRLEYRPTMGRRRGPTYFHDLLPGATLAADPSGRFLVILPGSRPFRVDWTRGIIG